MAYNYSKFSFSYTWKDNVATVTKEYYTRTDSGKSWKRKPYKTEVETVSGVYYQNYVQSIPWFNTRVYSWERTSCRAEWNYTWAGYIPTVITSVSPTGDEKIVAKFDFSSQR